MTAPAAALLLAALAWFATPGAEAPRVAAAVQSLPLLAATESATPTQSTLSASPPAPRQNLVAPVTLAGLLTAPEPDLRATLHAALAARAQGGRLYARALARRCADLAGLQVTEPPDVNDARHQRAVARQAALAAGCGQFANAEWLALVNIAADEPTADDPLLSLQQSDADDAALLQAVLALPDPLLLDELGARLLLRRIDGEPTLYFDGQRFDDDAGRATALAALRLLPCHFGLACDERDPEVWLACLRGAGCAGARAEQAPAEASALAARLAAAVRAQALARFLPPS